MSQLHPKLKGIIWLGVTVFIAAIFAVGLPFFAKLVPWSFETKMSESFNLKPDYKVCDQKNKIALKVIQRLYPLYIDDQEFPLQIEIVANPMVNAYAFLGGKIYVFGGLLKQAESPEELAGILAHEIEHVKRRHIMQGLIVRLVTIEGLRIIFSGGTQGSSELLSALLNMKFSREEESEADKGGLDRLKKAEIDSSGFANFFERAEKIGVPALLSDHPGHEARIELAKKYVGYPTKPIMTRDEWLKLKTICH